MTTTKGSNAAADVAAWIVTTDNAGAIPEHFRPLIVTTSDGETVICRLPDGRGEIKERARLIASAPKLLEALRTIARRAFDYPLSEMAQLNAETARAAIAKATS